MAQTWWLGKLSFVLGWNSTSTTITFHSVSGKPRQIWSLKFTCIDRCCIFRPAFGCCALKTLVEIDIFSVFAAKNIKKARILQQISVKNRFFLHFTKTLVSCFTPQKIKYKTSGTKELVGIYNLWQKYSTQELVEIFTQQIATIKCYHSWYRPYGPRPVLVKCL